MKAEYKSSLRSKKMIREAFFTLLKTKDINKITATDIIKLADINRSTFYAHYPDVYGVIEELEDEAIEKMLEILSNFDFKTFFLNPTPLLLEVSRQIEKEKEYYQLFIQNNISNSFFEKLKTMFAKFMLEDSNIPNELKSLPVIKIRISYFAGGIINLYKEWLLNRLDCSLNDISLEISKLLKLEANEDFFNS